jgi:hypothetical protein
MRCSSATKEAELRVGAAKSSKQVKMLRILQRFLSACETAQFNSEDAAAYADVRATMGLVGGICRGVTDYVTRGESESFVAPEPFPGSSPVLSRAGGGARALAFRAVRTGAARRTRERAGSQQVKSSR